jgi:hypothetical protein
MNNKSSVVDAISVWAMKEIGYTDPLAAEDGTIDLMTDAEFALYDDKRSQHPALDNPEMDAALDLDECYINLNWLRHSLIDIRWPDGISCWRCGSKDVRKGKKANGEWSFVCRDCLARFSFTSQTALHHTKFSLDYWVAIIVILGRARGAGKYKVRKYWAAADEVSLLLDLEPSSVYAMFNRIEKVADLSQCQNGMALLKSCLSTTPGADNYARTK